MRVRKSATRTAITSSSGSGIAEGPVKNRERNAYRREAPPKRGRWDFDFGRLLARVARKTEPAKADDKQRDSCGFGHGGNKAGKLAKQDKSAEGSRHARA